MRRSRDDIIGDILEAIDSNINRISSIMKNVNLSASLAKKYLSMLTDNGLIQEVDGEYKLTEKGRRVLEHFRKMRKIELELTTIIYEVRKELSANKKEDQVSHS
ncbi:putative winged helix-turn-helix protein [Saccharolobus shibatae B12]|uniref:Winged helix-turn-helix protein n=1 Tax=Saccharolobus shibatae (strain ATCC 51178 / DSM 5389 / JCM 8931 / NBRC 15437 / B12) TaxID=523848 RepID=A0A8F5GSS8_SACSH|nr:winged helix-turn-helix domain-containing protein [Saccharolobus shibatae]QXJ27647.1 putative winged helix-turn-helix protein [Saccharolobus shibatae B12]